MELNLVMAIINRDRREAMEDIIHGLKLPLALTMFAKGTATSEHLSLYGLVSTEKALIATVADAEQTRKLMRAAKLRMFVDIPGNGIMMSVPIKSVGGGKTMAYLTDNMNMNSEKPSMKFSHELIYVILNEGFSDMVMHAAFGRGMVLSVMKMGGDALLEIAFDDIGTKKLMLKTASAHMKKL